MRVLVTVASKHGSTAEIARIIGDLIRSEGHDVELRPPETVASVEPYGCVVIGSAVYGGQWLEPARAFVDRHRVDLLDRPVFLFSSGPLGPPQRLSADATDVDRIEGETQAIDHQTFAGRLDKSHLSRPERLIASVVRAPGGDFRPWEDISDWAREIGRFLQDEEPRRAAAMSAGR
jgi:menaquinone-dependent protoporphyrinogen oxidase